MYCLDSDILIAALRGDEEATAFIDSSDFTITVINAQEVLWGAILQESESKYESGKRFLDQFRILDYGRDAMERTVGVRGELRRKGRPIGFQDEMIAGICLANDLTLVTRNEKHFSKIKGLRIETW